MPERGSRRCGLQEAAPREVLRQRQLLENVIEFLWSLPCVFFEAAGGGAPAGRFVRSASLTPAVERRFDSLLVSDWANL